MPAGASSGWQGALGSSSSISRTASPAPVHPLHLPPSPLLPSSFSDGSVIPPHSASPSLGVRSRKGTPSNASPTAGSSSRVEADVTRPSLKRIVSSATTIVPALVDQGATAAGQSSGRGSLDELSRAGKEGMAEREIIVHELLKTDTIASISLQYGITPQALRTSNRLWPSDSIHLRKSLNIPLDQCHLPSATSGFERLVREEDGNIVVWQRPPPASAGIISPTARRLASASAFELGGENHQGSTADLIGLWATGSSASASTMSSARSSFDLPDEPSMRGGGSPSTWTTHSRYSSTNGGFHDSINGGGGVKGKGRGVESPAPADDAVANYLSNTHNLYSSATSNSSSSPAPLLSFSPSPSPAATAEGQPPPPPTLSPSTSTSSRSSAPPSPMQKKTLLISRVPSSQLSFFPPASAANSNAPSSSLLPSASAVGQEGPPSSNPRRKGGIGGGSFFGPLANSLARLNLSSLSSSSSSDSTTTGPIALGLGHSSWSSTPNSSAASSINGDASTTPKATGGGGGGWDLSYFGGEEEEGAWEGMGRTRGRGSAMGRPRGKLKD